MAGETADRCTATGQGLTMTGFADRQAVAQCRVAFCCGTMIVRSGPGLTRFVGMIDHTVAEGAVKAAGSSACITGELILNPQVGAGCMALGTGGGITLVCVGVSSRTVTPRLG